MLRCRRVSERDELTNTDKDIRRSQILSAQRLGSGKAEYDFLDFGAQNFKVWRGNPVRWVPDRTHIQIQARKLGTIRWFRSVDVVCNPELLKQRR
jgi:hypothetical protein